MGSILSKRTKKDKEKLQEDFDIGEQNDQIQIVPLQNKSVIHGLLIVCLLIYVVYLFVCFRESQGDRSFSPQRQWSKVSIEIDYLFAFVQLASNIIQLIFAVLTSEFVTCFCQQLILTSVIRYVIITHN